MAETKENKGYHTSDMLRARLLTRHLAQRLEAMLTGGIPEDPETLLEWRRNYDVLFGAKHSLTDTLATLVDLTLKLEKADQARADTTLSLPEEYSFSASDVALVRSFIERSTK